MLPSVSKSNNYFAFAIYWYDEVFSTFNNPVVLHVLLVLHVIFAGPSTRVLVVLVGVVVVVAVVLGRV